VIQLTAGTQTGGQQMTLKQHMKAEGMPQKVVERELTELLRKYDRECIDFKRGQGDE